MRGKTPLFIKEEGVYYNGDDPMVMITLQGRTGLYTADGLEYLIRSNQSEYDVSALISTLKALKLSRYTCLDEISQDAISGQTSLI